MARRIKPVRRPLANVKGRTAFVTGGSSGIGLGIARVLSAAGMKVVFTYRTAAHRDAALASFPSDNPGVHAIELDTTDRDAMGRAADEAESVFGPVHLLCNNAGVGLPALVSQVSWQDWDWALDVNVNGVFNGIRTFLPRMRKHGEGAHIMATASTAGIVAGTLGVYAASKFAVVGMMESLRTEMVGSNIGVSVYCPGLVRSDIFDFGRNRPPSHGTAPVEAGPPPVLEGAGPVDFMASAMDPLEAGRQVLEGIRRNDLYILSHPEWLPVVRERVKLMLASFSRLPVPAARRVATQAISPDIYAADLLKKRAAGTGRGRSGKARAASQAGKSVKRTGRRKAGVAKVRAAAVSRTARRPAARRRR